MGGFTPEELAAMRAGKISNYNDFVTFRDSVQKNKQQVEEDLKNKGNAVDSQVKQNTVDFIPSTSQSLQTQPPTQEDTAQQDTTLQSSNPMDDLFANANKPFKSQIFGGGHTEKSPLVQTKEEYQKSENGLLSTSSIVEEQQKEEYNNSMKDIQQRKKDAINQYLNSTQDKPSGQEGNYPNDYFGKLEDYSKDMQPILSAVASGNASLNDLKALEVYNKQLGLRTELERGKAIGDYQKAVMDELNVAAEADPKLKQDVINLAKETVKDNGFYKFYKDDEKFDYTDADWYKAGLKTATSQDEVLNKMYNNSLGTDYNPMEDIIGDMQIRVADNQSGIEKAQNLGLQIIDDGLSTACMIGGVAYGLASSGIDLGTNLYQGQDFIDALANTGLHIINNDITQYGVGVIETGSWAFDLEKQRELMREGLNKDAILGGGVGNEALRAMGSWGFTVASIGWGAIATKGVLAATTSLERKALRNGIQATRKELGSEVTEAAINDIKKEIRTSWIKKNSIVKSSAIPLLTATPEATMEAGSTYLHALDEGTTEIDETIQRQVDDYVNKKAREFYDAQQKNPKENKLIIDPSPDMINQWHQEGEALYTAKYQDAYKRIESDAKTATAINFFTNMAILTLSQATVQSTYLPKPVQSALKKSKVFGFANNIKPIYIRDAEGKLIKKFTPAQKVYMALRESGGEAVEEALQTSSQNINEEVVEGDITDYINKKYAADGGNVVGQSFGEHFGSAFVAFSNSLSAEETWEAAGAGFLGATIGGFGITHTGKFMFDFGRTGNYKTRKVRDPQTGELKVEYVTDSKGNKVEEKAVFKRGVNADGSKENWLDVAARMTPWRTGVGTTLYQETLRERTAFKDDAKRVEDFLTAYRTNGNWNGSLLDGLVGTVNAAADIEAAAETNDIFNMKNASVQQAVETSFVLNDLQNSEGLGKTLADEMLENINMTANAEEGSEIAQRLVDEYKQSDDFKKKEAAGVKMTDAQILQELKKSSNYMLDILNQVNETTEMVEATYGHFGLDNDTKQALVYSHIAVDNMSKRIDVLTEEINKLKYNTTSSASSLSDSQKALVSKYDGGLKEAIQRKTTIEKQIKSLDAKITNLNKEKKKFEKNPNSKITFSQSALDKITSERNKLVAELEQFKELEGLNYESGVLNEDEIMHLPVKQRAAMLLNGYEDIYNQTHDASKRVGKPKTSRLSQAQQNIVNALRRKLLEQDPQAMEKIIDVARLNVSKDRHVKQQEQIITEPKTFKDFVRKARMATLESQWMKDYVKLDNIADYNEFKKQFLPLFNSEEQLDLLKLSSIMKKLHTSSNKNFERWMKEDDKLTQQYEYVMNRCSAMDALNDDERTVFTAMLDWASLHCPDAFTYSKKGNKIKGFSFEKLQTALESEYNKGEANTFIPLVRGTYGIKSDVIPENLESLTSFFNILKESYDDKGVASPQETSNKSSRTAAKPSVSVTPNSEPVEETTEGQIEEIEEVKEKKPEETNPVNTQAQTTENLLLEEIDEKGTQVVTAPYSRRIAQSLGEDRTSYAKEFIPIEVQNNPELFDAWLQDYEEVSLAFSSILTGEGTKKDAETIKAYDKVYHYENNNLGRVARTYGGALLSNNGNETFVDKFDVERKVEELVSPEEEEATTIVNEDTGETISVEEQKQNDIEKAFNLKNVDDSKITVEPDAKLSSAIRIADKTNTSSIVVQKNKDGEYEVVKTTEGVTQNVIQGLYNTMQDNSCVKVIGMQEFPTNLFKLVGEYKENGQTFRTYKKLTLQEESSAQEEKYGPSITNLPAASTQRVATSDILDLKQQDETKGTTTFSTVTDFYENNIVPTLKQVYQKLQNKQNVEVFFVVDQELDNAVSSSMGNKYDPLKYSGVVAVIEVEKGTGKYQIGGKDYSPIGIVPTGNARTNAPEGFYVSQEIRSRAYDVKHKKLRTNVLLKGEDKNPLKSKLLKVNAKQPKHLDVNISAKQFAERTWKNNADEEFLSRLVFDPKRKGTKWYVKPAELSAMSNPNHDIFIPYARDFKINGVIIGSTNSNNEQYTVLNIFQNPFNNDVWNDLVQNNVCIEKAADQLKKAIIELKKEENLNLLRDLSDPDLSDEEKKQIKKTINGNPEIANSLKYMQNQFSLPVSFNIGTTENGVCLVSEKDRFYMANLEDLEKLDLSDAASINQMVYSGLRQFFVDSEGNEKLRLPKDATMEVTNDDGTVITQRIPGAGTPFAYFQVDSKLLSKYQEEKDRKALGALKKFYEQGFFEVSAEDDSERMGVAYFSTPENLSEETPKPEVVVTNKDNANIDSPLPTDEATQTPVYDNTADNAAPESSPVTTLANQITEDSKEHFENKKARGGNHAILSVTNLLRAQEHSQTIVRSSETSQNEEEWSVETAFGNTIDGAVRNILDSNYEVAINNNKLQRRKKGQRGSAWENFTDFTPNMSERALQKLYTDIVITLNPFIQKGYTILSQDIAVRGTQEIFGDNTPHYANFSGELDLLLLSPEGHSAIIIDMKTSKSVSIDNEEYKQQQKTYAECLQKTYPQLTDISAYLFGFTTPRISDELTRQDDSDQLYITKYGKTEKFKELSVSTQGLIEIDLQNTSVDRVMWDKLTQEQRDEILRQEADKTSQSNATQSSTSETVEYNLFQETSKHIKERAERKAREEKTETNETEAKSKKTFERRNYRSKNSPEENKKNNCAK